MFADLNTNDLIDNGAGVTAHVINAGIKKLETALKMQDLTYHGDCPRTNSETTINSPNLMLIPSLNADVSPTAAIVKVNWAMQAATTRANDTGINQADLGLASFDPR